MDPFKTMDELTAFAKGTEEKLAAIDELNKAQAEEKKVLKEQAEALETEKVALKAEVERVSKNLGDLVLIFKKDFTKEDTLDGKAARWGEFMLALTRNDPGSLVGMGAKKMKGVNEPVIDEHFMKQVTDMAKLGKMGPIDETPHAKADLGTPIMGDSGTGQYLLPQNLYEGDVLRTAEEQSQLIPAATRFNMTGRKHLIPAEATNFAFTYISGGEDDAVTEQNPTFAQRTLTAGTYAGYVGVSEDLQQDNIVDLGRILRIQMTEAFQQAIEDKMINNNNSPSNNYGILRDAAVNNQVMDGNSFSAVDWDDLSDLIKALTTKKKRRGSSLLMHPTIWDLLREKKGADGHYFWDPANTGPMTAKGYPVILSDEAPELTDSAASTSFIGFGNMRQIVYGVLRGLTIGYYPNTQYKVTYLQNFFLAHCRLAVVIGLPANLSRLKTSA